MKLLIYVNLSIILVTQTVIANPAAAVQFYHPANPDAAKRLTLLANQGDAEAQNRLGIMYANGQNVKRDSAQAVAWFRKSAAQGNANGQYDLGVMYQTGQGVARDNSQAVSWIRKAAAQRHALALNNLGWLYAHGQGVPYQPVVAYALYSISADADAVNGVYAIKNRAVLVKFMRNREIDAAQRLTHAMQVPGHLLTAMDIYLASHAPIAP